MALCVTDATGDRFRIFQFDTGCGLTTVSEDVATALGLPAGGKPIRVSGTLGSGKGRLVPVTFQFPADSLSGVPGDAIDSEWAILSGRSQLALLGFQEVHRHYSISTDDDTMYFARR